MSLSRFLQAHAWPSLKVPQKCRSVLAGRVAANNGNTTCPERNKCFTSNQTHVLQPTCSSCLYTVLRLCVP